MELFLISYDLSGIMIQFYPAPADPHPAYVTLRAVKRERCCYLESSSVFYFQPVVTQLSRLSFDTRAAAFVSVAGARGSLRVHLGMRF